jgi:hypothetical protein
VITAGGRRWRAGVGCGRGHRRRPARRAGRSYRAARTVRGVAAFGRSEEEKESGRAEDIFGGCTVGFGGVKLHR